ncbi:hypothetical protein INT43_003175 [Umbelopsis isabellina]|uniref:t-SNARE coiled-coil homology domain-containing protein n=1 Tax=Mortierella isabellina TaxID=91625 RepID=A0A8H7PQ91_MORIS|nr:hypothetical protein INT43_003175 [Umbelopsis isabellina]
MSRAQKLDQQLSATLLSLQAHGDLNTYGHAQELLHELENCLQESEASEYPQQKAHARIYRRQLAAMAREIEAETSDNRRNQLLGQTQRLDSTSDRLRNIQSIALENERIGTDILGTLRGQRETLVRSKDTINEAEDNVDRSTKTLKSMASWW